MTNNIQTTNALQAADNSLQKAFSQKSAQPNTLGKEDFLKLLMAQVTHQDPLNPMDSQGMMDQLTGMGSLEQLVNINESLAGLKQTQNDVVRANAYSFLNKDVKLRGGALDLHEGKATDLQFQIPREAEQVRLTVIDPEGNAVRSLELGPHASGNHTVQWDGLTSQGHKAPDGSYRYNVTAKTADGEQLPVDMFRQGKVSGVRFDGERPKLRISGEDVDLRDVIEMSNRSERIFGNRLPATLREEIRSQPPVTRRRQ